MFDPNEKTTKALIQAVIDLAIQEDVGSGDVTTNSTIPADATLTGRFLAKQSGVVAGMAVAEQVFKTIDPTLVFESTLEDGARITEGEIFATISGNCRAILVGERTALNFMQRMSGIATQTREFVDAVSHTKCGVLDTRKTAPGMRMTDKWAVKIGGGTNHRIGLYDQILIKDNHIAAVGGITEAVSRARSYDKESRPLIVEVQTIAELEETLKLNVSRILLDNMSPKTLRECVAITGGKVPLEASGGVNLRTAAAYAESGVDFISTGALTHSVTALDISLDLDSLGGN